MEKQDRPYHITAMPCYNEGRKIIPVFICWKEWISMAYRTFAEELDMAVKRLGGDIAATELERVHMDASRDKKDPMKKVDIKGPEPWRRALWEQRTGLTI